MILDRATELANGLGAWALLVAGAGWVVLTLLTLGAVALFVVRLPVGYFVDEAPPRPLDRGGWTGRIARNLLGVALIALGALLSLPGIPGQGLLTILIGAMLVDFPGRRRLERALVARPGVLAALNALRARWRRPPLLPPRR